MSFPSQFNTTLPTCFPSSLFRELLSIKQKLQLCLSTRSLNDTFSECCHVDNINLLTWLFIIKHLLPNIPLVETNDMVKQSFFKSDSFVLEKRRCNQQQIEFYLPEHMAFVQSIFGTFAGIGSRKILRCTLKKRPLSTHTCNSHQVLYTDEYNVIPFERDCPIEFVRRGIIIKYIPEEQQLTLQIRFHKLKGREESEPQFRLRSITIRPLDSEDERIPLHSDITVFGKTIYAHDLIVIRLTDFSIKIKIKMTISKIVAGLCSVIIYQ